MYFSNPRVTAVGEQPLQASLWDQRPVGAFCSAAEKAGVWGIRCLWVHTETMDSRELFQQLRGSFLSRRSGTQYSPWETQLGEAQSWRPGYHHQISCQKKKYLSEAQGPEMFMAHTQKKLSQKCAKGPQSHLECPMIHLILSPSQRWQLTILQPHPDIPSCLLPSLLLMSADMCFILLRQRCSVVAKTAF